jgi:hypothetical protein
MLLSLLVLSQEIKVNIFFCFNILAYFQISFKVLNAKTIQVIIQQKLPQP